jgi:hypothetical protein
VLNLLFGHELIINETEIDQMIEVSTIFHFDALKTFISKHLLAPQSFEDSIKYIKQSTQFFNQKHLNQTISITAK